MADNLVSVPEGSTRVEATGSVEASPPVGAPVAEAGDDLLQQLEVYKSQVQSLEEDNSALRQHNSKLVGEKRKVQERLKAVETDVSETASRKVEDTDRITNLERELASNREEMLAMRNERRLTEVCGQRQLDQTLTTALLISEGYSGNALAELADNELGSVLDGLVDRHPNLVAASAPGPQIPVAPDPVGPAEAGTTAENSRLLADELNPKAWVEWYKNGGKQFLQQQATG